MTINSAPSTKKTIALSKNSSVCPKCGWFGSSKIHTPGSTGMELFLWLLFLIPGLIYSVWRVTARKSVCVDCGSSNLIPAFSFNGKKSLRSRMSHSI